MRLIASRPFRNTSEIEVEKHAGHPMHIPKGAFINIGKGKTLQELKPAEKELVTLLNGAGCISDAEDEKSVKAILAEVAEETKSAAPVEHTTAPVKK